MPKPIIQIATFGQPPPDFNAQELISWKTNAFCIRPGLETYQLNEDAAGDNWEYTDAQFEKIPRDPQCAFLIIFVKVKLKDNWYLRRLSDNRIVFSFYEMEQIVRFHGLPLRNLALRILYAAILVYKRYGNRIPPAYENTNYAHDETRGCLFDMNANKIDVVSSLHHPRICEHCSSQLRKAYVPNELLATIQKEIHKIQKPLIDQIITFVRAHTGWSIALSIFSALLLGVIASLAASWLYEYIGK